MHVIVASHGSFCTGAVQVYEMVAGKSEGITAVSLSFDDTGQFAPELRRAVESHLEGGVLILCDIVGGTPYNESLRLALEHPQKVELLANMNLPMLIEVGMALDRAKDLDDLYQTAVNAGIESIKLSARNERERLANQDEDDDSMF